MEKLFQFNKHLFSVSNVFACHWALWDVPSHSLKFLSDRNLLSWELLSTALSEILPLVHGFLLEDPMWDFQGSSSIQFCGACNFSPFWNAQTGSSVTSVKFQLERDLSWAKIRWYCLCSHPALCETVRQASSQGTMTPGCPGIFLSFNLWGYFCTFQC